MPNQMGEIKNWKIDTFGFLTVWVPYGRPTCIEAYGSHKSYCIKEEDLTNNRSNSTLKGIDLTVMHPDRGVTADNYKETSVGTVLGKVRKTGDVYEVLCKVKDSETVNKIINGQLREASAMYYDLPNKTRVYNSIALVPYGYARNGTEMELKAESNNITQKTMELTNEQIESIANATAAKFYTIAKDEDKITAMKAECFTQGVERGKELAQLDLVAISMKVESEDKVAGVIEAAFGLKAEGMTDIEKSVLTRAAISAHNLKLKAEACSVCAAKKEAGIEIEIGEEDDTEEEDGKPMAKAKAESMPIAKTEFSNTSSVPSDRISVPRRAL